MTKLVRDSFFTLHLNLRIIRIGLAIGRRGVVLVLKGRNDVTHNNPVN